MVLRRYVTAWNVVVLAVLLGICVFVGFVIDRNVGAARARRSVVPPIASDFDPSPYNFTTEKLPSDSRFMCSVGNGHVATDIFSDTVYMNGLYNGAKGNSHRARVPAWCNIRLNSTMGSSGHFYSKPTYTLDTKHGSFHVHVQREWSTVDQRIFAHRYYTRAIVNQFFITAKHKADIWRDHNARHVPITFLHGPESEDIDFQKPQIFKFKNKFLWWTCGKTKVLEDPDYQRQPTPVCAYWTYVPPYLIVPRRGRILYTFVMTLDTNKEVALREMINVLQEKGEDLFERHTREWQRIHENGRIEIEGNLELEKIVNGIWYYFQSSLPSLNTNQPNGMYYGLSPGGLSRGASLKDYEGHNFWDTELWMFPSILLFNPDHAETLLRYRINMMRAAADLARATNNKGIRFPWESAYTGREVTQPCCPEVAEFEHHITGCIAFAVRQYLAVAESEEWLTNSGCELIFRIADFWASRAVFNESSRFYDIHNVMGPDEDHSNVTNSAFTNVIAGYALYLGQYTSCLCENYTLPIKRGWADMARHLALPYDSVLDYHPQFEGYTRPDSIKQADVTLLGFPLQYVMDRSTRANDLTYYENVTRESGPAMTWSMHAVSHLQIGNSYRAYELFNSSYQGYVREPFKIWTEYRKPRIGSVNFLTGMGGFLQAIIFGYAGISIHLDRLEIARPQLLPRSTRLRLNGIKYLGSNFSLAINPNNVTLEVSSVDVDRPLELVLSNNKIAFKHGIKILLHGEGPFYVQKRIPSKCEPPADKIGERRL